MNLKHLAALAAVAALAAPTAATAGSDNAKSGKAKTERVKKAKKAKKPKLAVFKGTVTAVDATAGTLTVAVDRANKWGRAYKDSFSALDFTYAGDKKVGGVEDVNADGATNLGDVAVGNLVLVQARVAKDQAAPLAAKKVNVSTPETDE